MPKPDIVFICRKCQGHEIYVDIETLDAKKFGRLLRRHCPACGEEPHENWIMVRLDDYKKKYPGRK